MELSRCHTTTRNFCSSIPTHKAKGPSTVNPWRLRLIRPRQNHHGSILMQQRVVHKRSAVVARCAADMGCSSGSSVSETEGELEAEVRPEGAAEWLRVGRLREKCGGDDRGVAELLECLEREAIMGEDEGKEPKDYNRRAQIFYKSSRVFQALRERSES